MIELRLAQEAKMKCALVAVVFPASSLARPPSPSPRRFSRGTRRARDRARRPRAAILADGGPADAIRPRAKQRPGVPAELRGMDIGGGKDRTGDGAGFCSGDRRTRRATLADLVDSPGGSVADAMAMGRLIRARRLAVAVARTVLAPCAPPARECGVARGTALSFSAGCASACPLILAGGVERYASPVEFIGVHQITRLVTQVVLARRYEVHYRIVDGKKERDFAHADKRRTLPDDDEASRQPQGRFGCRGLPESDGGRAAADAHP